MSDRGIVLKIDERTIVEAINRMCAESLPPDAFAAWEEVRDALRKTRKRLADSEVKI